MKFRPFPTLLKCGAFALLISFSTGCKKNETLERSGNTQSLSNPNNPYSSANEHIISEEEAAEYTQRFKEQHPGVNTQGFYTKRAVYEIFTQPGAENIRYYFGRRENGSHELFLIGADKNDNDIVEGDIIGTSPAELLSSRKEQIDWQDSQLTGLETAAASTKRHRKAHPEALLGGIFTKETIHLLLLKNNVSGVFVEYGITEDNAWVAILRPLDKAGNVIASLIIEAARRCPPSCGKVNSLNSNV